MGKNFYELLGVESKATEPEIKLAYRKLAIQLHPDKNPEGNTKEAFTEAARAYETLYNPVTRAEYDDSLKTGSHRPSAVFRGNKAGGPAFDFVNALRQFMNTVSEGSYTTESQDLLKGKDISLKFAVTLEDIYSGGDKTIKLNRKMHCKSCAGKGSNGGSEITCQYCAGHGKVLDPNSNSAVLCPNCLGTKTQFSDPCMDCKGKGISEASEKITFSIPKGVSSGNMIEILGKGHSGVRNAISGNLVITFMESIDESIQRNNADIYRNVNVDMFTMILGGKASFPHITGEDIVIDIVPHSQVDTLVQSIGYGLPYYNDIKVGDCFCRLKPQLPENLNDDQIALFKEIQQHISIRHLPDSHSENGCFIIILKPQNNMVDLAQDVLTVLEQRPDGEEVVIDVTSFGDDISDVLLSSFIKVTKKLPEQEKLLLAASDEVETIIEELGLGDFLEVMM
ncbi:MAG: DnaJ domain-containing protein [Fibrobacterales bacterium]